MKEQSFDCQKEKAALDFRIDHQKVEAGALAKVGEAKVGVTCCSVRNYFQRK
jgi:hypothetical protein